MKLFALYFLFILVVIAPLVYVVNAQMPYPALIITEIMPNPIGDDTKYEWIEIQNVSASNQNLKDWTLNTKAIPETVIEPGEIVMLVRDVTGFQEIFQVTAKIIKLDFNLVNTGGTVKLEHITNGEKHHFDYSQSQEGKSFELLEGDCGIIKLSSGHTVGQINTSCIGPEPTVTASVIPTVIYHTADSGHNTTGKAIISTISPNPDTGDEWIEIKNIDTVTLNLASWKIIDESNKAFTIGSLILASGQTERIFPKNVSLNNDGDVISLYDAQGKLIDTFSYPKSVKGQLFSKDSDNKVITVDDSNSDDNSTEDEESNQLAGAVLSSQSTRNVNYNIYFKKPVYYKSGDYVR